MLKRNLTTSRKLIDLVRNLYGTQGFIPLYEPTFCGNEKNYLNEAIDSTYVSSVGKFVDQFEAQVESFTKVKKAVATVNGTAALHAALYLSGVGPGDLVLTQALTFVATCNAISQLGASPVFIDIECQSFGLCPVATESWLTENAYIDVDGHCRHSDTNAIIRALMPMHTFGHPVMLDQLELVSKTWNLVLLEDAAESLGSLYRGRHTGTIGRFGALSFNGNKIITTGGGGMILCRDRTDGDRAKHVTTTAKVPHLYEFYHDESGFNYRLPNLNAALGCAQMEQLNKRLVYKRKLAKHYADFFDGSEFEFLEEPGYAQSNYWLNTVICQDFEARNDLLRETNEAGVMTRPVWQLMHRLPMFSSALRGSLVNSEWAEQRLVNLPSCVNGVIG